MQEQSEADLVFSIVPLAEECMKEMWSAYCAGSMPIGAVIVDDVGVVVARGRNRIYEQVAPDLQVAYSPLAHAELNALLQISLKDKKRNSYTLYASMEPSSLCK